MDLLYKGLVGILTIDTFFLIALGTIIGLVIGTIPGLTATMALALLVPFTFAMDALNGLVMLGAVYTAAMYGGAFTAILINTPGTPGAIATMLDGHPMAAKGEAERAIVGATVASVCGGVAGFVALLFLAPVLSLFALRFGPPEYFWVAVLGLALIAGLSTGSIFKGLLGGGIGMLLGTIGISPVGGEARFLFGTSQLQGGVELIVALIGLFAVPEYIRLTATAVRAVKPNENSKPQSLLSVTKEVIYKPINIIRSSIIGVIIGLIPGAGNNVAGLLAYSEAKRSSRTPEMFGKGSMEGLVASESSNNAAVPGSMVPLLTLGVPGSPPAAVLFGALMMHGLTPGTRLFTDSGVLTYGFIFSLGLAALALLPVGMIFGRLIFRAVTKVPLGFLIPTIAMMTILGAYSMRNSMTDVFIMVGVGIFGYVMRNFGVSPATIALGLILGPIAEQGFAQAMLIGRAYDYPFLVLLQSPLSITLAIIVAITLIGPFVMKVVRRKLNARKTILG
ncbi:tripartite tricarboxylate transporter permease [Halomonas heilongjiangensis]|uniref:C4-dicarboxylate ABC transporter permease n=1 Tax=Halomonas heilongjiangensis TaxID=1387883 RepID=A0A2N7TIW2_9GAMM|nr:tripartite tricarboxylate transporter permease [Halomonas heilongjiangensis]PMR68122.1 C4-dicarboxylate ABC transporter permease [Halomonas heilongjiangensis]PXX93191.1 C4-dicarboxylate ABC transporter permease [Halomonas heilongjiangensis]